MKEHGYRLDSVDKAHQRVPLVFIVDTNFGMKHSLDTSDGMRIIDKLNRCFNDLFRGLTKSYSTMSAVDITIVTTGNGPKVEQEFRQISSFESHSELPELTAEGSSNVFESICKSYSILNNYIEALDEKGFDRKPALVWLLHESEPLTGTEMHWDKGQRIIKKATEESPTSDSLFFGVEFIGPHRIAALEGLNKLISTANEQKVAVFGHRYENMEDLFQSIADITIEHSEPSGYDAAVEAIHSGTLDFESAILREANLPGADLSGADLSEQDISGANLSRADLSEADLSDANLSEADLTGATLEGTDLTGADLTGATISNTDFSHVDLKGCTISENDTP
jgi:uncharacterized protein YegL